MYDKGSILLQKSTDISLSRGDPLLSAAPLYLHRSSFFLSKFVTKSGNLKGDWLFNLCVGYNNWVW